MKQRMYVVIENREDNEVVCVKTIGLKGGIPWRQVRSFEGKCLASYSSKGDWTDFKNHGVIEKFL